MDYQRRTLEKSGWGHARGKRIEVSHISSFLSVCEIVVVDLSILYAPSLGAN